MYTERSGSIITKRIVETDGCLSMSFFFYVLIVMLYYVSGALLPARSIYSSYSSKPPSLQRWKSPLLQERVGVR
jgi:hypothetical protein